MLEMSLQIEHAEVQEKIAGANPGVAGMFPRWRWRTRSKQLTKTLAELDLTIKRLERQIAFVEPPKARRKGLPKL
jgi:hypothetical protein